MKIFEQIISKEEKAAIVDDIENLKEYVTKLQKASPDELKALIANIKPLIESFLSIEEKDILDKRDKINTYLETLENTSEIVSDIKNEVESQKKYINETADEIQKVLEDNDAKSTSIHEYWAKAAEELTEITNKKNALTEIENEIEQLSAKAEVAQAKLQLFDQVVQSVEESKSKVNLTQKNIVEAYLKIKELYTETFGREEKNEETGEVVKIEGLVSKLKNSYTKIEIEMANLQEHFEAFEAQKNTEYNKIKEIWEEKFTDLTKQIESLLPGALSAGLSQAYEEKKNTEIAEIKKSNIVFYSSIGGLILISLFPIGVYWYLLAVKDKTLEDAITLAPNILLTMLPLYLPCLWVAHSSDKKSKLSKRLAEEYAHKSSLSKTFEGISKQVSNISDDKLSAELETKLLYNLIQVSSENPGKLISDYNKTDHPLFEALDRGIAYSESLEKISLIPGVNKIFESVQHKRKKRVEDLVERLPEEGAASRFGNIVQ